MITCYLTDIENLDTGENGVKFKFDPERLLYALRWKHKAEPADAELTLLFGALNRADPHLFEKLHVS